MPQIVVKTTGPDGTEVFRERVQPRDLETQASARLLIERLGWAISDASLIEADPEPGGPEPGEETS
jgi:hypothetical protein